MISARHWRERRTFLAALVFWGWLASFIFGFVASDAFHSARCPEQWALASVHNGGPVAAQLSALPAVHLDLNCPSCLLQLSAQGILAVASICIAPLLASLALPALRPASVKVCARKTQSRGPPLAFI